jgi:hypothetical protein
MEFVRRKETQRKYLDKQRKMSVDVTCCLSPFYKSAGLFAIAVRVSELLSVPAASFPFSLGVAVLCVGQ